MARSHFDRGPGGRGATAALGLLLSLGWTTVSITPAAGLSGDLFIESRKGIEYTPDGVMTAEDVLITHGSDTRITASHARHARRSAGSSELDLNGKVHIEFHGALLDADTAVLQFRGQDLLTVTVKGSQAQFSHLPEGYSRRINGRADTIDYDAGSGEVKFSGNTSYTDGRNTLDSDGVIYNINDGTARDDGDRNTRGRAVIKLGESTDRVPPPRQPDRSTAE